MKSMKKLAALLMAAVLVGVFVGAAFAENRLEKILKAGKVTVAIEPYFPPFDFLDNTKTGQEAIRGCDVDLAKFIAEKLGVELELVPLSFAAVQAGIAQGKYDLAISALAYTPRRAQSLEMSEPYQADTKKGYSLLVRKEDAEKYKSFDDFDGVLVGYHSGTLQEQLVETQLPKAKGRVYDELQNAVLALKAGKIEAVGISVSNGEMFVAANPELAVLPLRFVMEKDGTCVAATKGEVELIARINEIIAEVVEKGLFEQWMAAAEEEASRLGVK